MNRRLLRQILALSAAILLMFAFCQSSSGAPRNNRSKKKDTSIGAKIPESKRPWAGMPWVAGMVLTGGAVAIGMKNSHRSHLD